MRPELILSTAIAAFIHSVPTVAMAQTTVLSGDYSVQGALCVGDLCSTPENFYGYTMKLKSEVTRIYFNDTTLVGSAQATRDWGLLANDGALDFFAVQDVDAGTLPLVVDGGAPENALRISDTGDVGLGTSLPLREFHIIGGDRPAIRLEQDTSQGNGNHDWTMETSDTGFALVADGVIAANRPFVIENDVGDNGFYMTSAGLIGMGTDSPATGLHMTGDNGNAAILIDEHAGPSNPRTLLNLQNNGRPEIVMGNTATNGEWSFGAGTDFFLKVGTVGSTSGQKTKVFTVKGNGDAIVAGTLTTGGTTCGGGCDRVFTDRAIIAPDTYATAMWAQGYLPHVGPTQEGAPINVSEKLGGMLNALEHAHVFIDRQRREIERQNEEVAQLREEVARLASVEERLSRIEAALAD